MAEKVEAVPIEQWGKDHWSTLAYVESRCVDHGGWLDGDHMRCNPRSHREFEGKRKTAFGSGRYWKPEYSTRLRGHTETTLNQVEGHDDWDCLSDMLVLEVAFIVDRVGRIPGFPIGGERLCIALTGRGFALAGELRKHMAHERSYAAFIPQEPESNAKD